jgi:PAS domain S-box-containing protein
MDERVPLAFERWSPAGERCLDVRVFPTPEGVGIFFRDVTEERRAADALRESETRLRLAQQAARAGVWEGDFATGEVTWSPEYYALYGLDPGTVSPSYAAWLACVHPDDRERVAAETREAFAEGREQYTEFRIVTRADGDRPYRWVASTGRVLERVDGRPRRVAGIALDITDRMRAEEARREAEARFRRVVDSDIVGVLFWSAAGGITGANDAFLQMVGRTREELERGAIDWRMLTPPEWVAQDAARIRELRETGSTAPFEKEYLRPDGSRVPVLVHGATYEHTRDEGVAVVLDLTARKRTEAERDALLARAMDARAEAESANQAKSQFLATMSHELRTPLNAIGGYADLLQMEIKGPVTDGQRDYLDRIQRAKSHLLGLINDVLDFARIEAGRMELHATEFGVDEVAADVEALVAPLAEAKRLRFSRTGGPPARVRADRDRTRQVLLNLLSNAVKFTEGEGSVEMAWETDGRDLHVRVRDTGRGIPPEMMERVFEPFVQVEPDLNRTAQGTGLGLAISRELARSMGGDLVLDSTSGRGSTFTLRLPLADPAESRER